MRAFVLSLAVLLTDAAHGQPADPRPAFDAADVHPSAPARNPFRRGPYFHAGRYELRSASMADLVSIAYEVPNDHVWGGPSWLEWSRFDVAAKAPADSKPAARRHMLQSLLAERFKLVVHNDTEPLPAFALTALRHQGLKPADGTGETGCKWDMQNQPGDMPGNLMVVYNCHNVTMQAFAQEMRNGFGPELPLVDRTDLKGTWNFSFKFTPRGFFGPAQGERISMFDAFEKQLGLKLELTRVATPVIAVDSVHEQPTENVANIKDLLPPQPPMEFEVAVIKPSNPEVRGRGPQFQPGGRVNLQFRTLKILIQQAWNVPPDMILGAPAWMDSDHWDIVAKASDVGASENGRQIDLDAMWAMMRALLMDRFKLAVHFESRPMTAYTLVAAKPKLKKADPATRTRCTEGLAEDTRDDPRDRNPARSRLVTCQNITMPQFAERLQWTANGYIHSPVIDATGLEGGFDFTLNFSPAGLAQGLGRGGPVRDGGPGEAPAASDPNGAISLFDAVEKQLGLKLEAQKRPVEVLVIDHAEQKPTEN